LKWSRTPSESRQRWCAACAMEKLFARRLDMSQLYKHKYIILIPSMLKRISSHIIVHIAVLNWL
jgi:hypothetical protein